MWCGTTLTVCNVVDITCGCQEYFESVLHVIANVRANVRAGDGPA